MSPQFISTVDFPKVPSEGNYFKILRAKAEDILKTNIFTGTVDTRYTTASGQTTPEGETKPRFLYPFQWLWDTFFIAGWSSDVEQSITDIDKFLAGQREDGFLGHIRYNREILARKEYFPPPDIYYPEGLPEKGEIISKITQPPNVAYGISELAKKINNADRRREFLESTFSKTFKYHKYIYENLSDNGLMVTIHPWQSGDDNSPKWDAIYNSIRVGDIHHKMEDWLTSLGLQYERADVKIIHHTQRPRSLDYDIYLYLIWLYNEWGWNEKVILSRSPFRVTDPLTNSVLQRSNHCLLQIALELNRTDEAEVISEWISKTKKGLESLWNEDKSLYYAKDLNTGHFIRIDTISSLMPLFTYEIPDDKAKKLAQKINQIKTDSPLIYLVPSTFPREVEFEPIRYWRGPVWIVVNVMIADGLKHYGYDDLAREITIDSLKLIYTTMNDNGGFCEYFDPLTGKGLGSPLQSWTAAATLHLTDQVSVI